MKDRIIATLILYNKDKKILLQHRDEDASINPGYWGSFGGHLEKNETPEIALRREILEEIEYNVKSPKLLCTKKYEQDDRQVISYTYVEEYDAKQTIVLHEGQGYGWFTIAEALKLKISKHRRNVLIKVKDFLKGK